ncbi:MAG: glucose-6-phosphate isomerase [Gammaproteobacteria bacterium]|nr:glucose-6-phosphate isomerase [Gammaproteobacteria bacterium]
MTRLAAKDLPAWKQLAQIAAKSTYPSVAELLPDERRHERLMLATSDVLFDFSKQRITEEVLDTLLQLAEQRNWRERIEELFNGELVNTTEGRAALHTALRAPPNEQPSNQEVHRELKRLSGLAERLTDASFRGYTGKAITDIVHIGIGGSQLGPELVVAALKPAHSPFRCHFVANVDGHAIDMTLCELNPETTLFVVVSKSFATLETVKNAQTARSWMLERTGASQAIALHFVAVTNNLASAIEFGIAPHNCFAIWQWVGGRFSLWSAVGLPIILCLGIDGFQDLLAGAHAMDNHFRTAPAEANAPLLAALIGIWNYNFLGVNNHAVLPYDERLKLLPNYLQQLETESNGKSVRHDGSDVGVHTMAVLWGGVGTTGQHAFHQLLHQGTRAFTADFILAARANHEHDDHHRWLTANCFSQSQAMAQGQHADDPHQSVAGNHATNTFVLDRLDGKTLGALLAFYEHKVFCQGLIWDINSFDQWGVELGKRLANVIYEQLGGRSAILQDTSTRALIQHVSTAEGTP